MNSRIVSTGSYIPEVCVDNEAFEPILDTSDVWIRSRTGIQTRYFESRGSSHMAIQAAKEALKEIDYESIDAIILATYTPDTFIPSCASNVKKALGIKRHIPTFDVNAACTGFLIALQSAHAYLHLPKMQRILVIGVDQNSKFLDFTDRSTAILFGDGAGAVVVEAASYRGIQTIETYSEDDSNSAINVEFKGRTSNPFINMDEEDFPFFTMKGSDVFKFAIKRGKESIETLCRQENWSYSSIRYVISHQANTRILDFLRKQFDMDENQFPMNCNRIGNTSSASIPILLDELNKENKLQRGDRLVFVAFGGGLTYGCALITW